jgi:hypothetical protein
MAQSPEEVAFRLMEAVANVEKKALHAGQLSGEQQRADRAWILSTYAACLAAVRAEHRPRPG